MLQTILGIFSNRSDVEEVLYQLKNRGFNPKDVSIVMEDEAHEEQASTITMDAKLAKGAGSGAAAGAIMGGLAGLFVAVAFPGIGGFLLGGPISLALGLTGAAAATASGAVTGAVAGGILGGLVGLGLNQHEAAHYDARVQAGAIIVAVPTDKEEAHIVREIFDFYNATDVRTITHPNERAERDYGRSRAHFGR